MVFAFDLPTTAPLSFQPALSSPSHPALLLRASACRHVLQSALERYHALAATDKPECLPAVLDAVDEYVPYLMTITRALRREAGENDDCSSVEIASNTADLTFVWHPVPTPRPSAADRFSSLLPKRDARPRLFVAVSGTGIELELAFVLVTRAFTLSLLARKAYLETFYAPRTPSPDQRTAVVQLASRRLLDASSVHAYLVSLLSPTRPHPVAVTSYRFRPVTGMSAPTPVQLKETPGELKHDGDLDASTHSALSSLCLAEATALAIAKDDPYLASSIQSCNEHDVEWMIKAPELPKIRTSIFARLAARAAEHAQDAIAALGAASAHHHNPRDKANDDLTVYLHTLRAVGQAKACRFLGVDAKTSGATGDGIAWLRAAKAVLAAVHNRDGEREVSMPLNDERDDHVPGSKRDKRASLAGLKSRWKERREERREVKERSGLSSPSPPPSWSSSSSLSSSFAGLPRGKSLWGDNGCEHLRREESNIIHTLEASWTRLNNSVRRTVLFVILGIVHANTCFHP